MDLKKPVLFLAAALILGLSACGGTPSEGAIQTAIAQTSVADEKIENAVNATLTAVGKGGGQETPPPATADFTSAPSTGTPTQGIVTVGVSANTWCSKGPGLVYDKVFIFYVGQTAEVIGREEFGQYWLIKKPDNPAITCWLWGKYATIIGGASKLPLVTPPPTPTPPAISMVTAVTITFAKSVIHGSCTFSNTVTITITTNGPAMVHYILKKYFNGGEQVSSENDMNFAAAGSQSFQLFPSLHSCGTYGYKVIVTTPNSMTAEGSFQVFSN
jgi:hypothetical protein